MTIQITTLAPDDLAAAGALLDEAFGRHGMVRNLRLAYALQPGSWFCGRRDGVLLSVVGAHDYGSCASIGMMAVAPASQRQGLARGLMAHLLAYLDGRGCPLSYLDASAAGRPLYPKLGFEADGETWRMVRWPDGPAGLPGHSPQVAGQGSMAAEARSPDNAAQASCQVRLLAASDLPAVIAFDTPRFGTARSDVLRAFYDNCRERAYLALDAAGRVTGYLMAEQSHLGPWVAASPAAAERLLQAALNLTYQAPPLLTLPAANQAATALLAAYSFLHTETLLHMRRGGDADPRDCKQIYAQASLTLG